MSRPPRRSGRSLREIAGDQAGAAGGRSVVESAQEGPAWGPLKHRERDVMKTRAFGLCLIGIVSSLAAASGLAQAKAPAPAGTEARLAAYLANFLPYDPGTKVTVERSVQRLPGFQGWKYKRTGKYSKLAKDG